MGFKFEPVRWLTIAVIVMGALLSTAEIADLLPDRWIAILTGIAAVITAVLGELARNRVTPLAAPENNAGETLVPVSSRAQSPSRYSRP